MVEVDVVTWVIEIEKNDEVDGHNKVEESITIEGEAARYRPNR